MKSTVLAGRGREILRISAGEWERSLEENPRETREVLSFMSKDHHRVRNHTLDRLAVTGMPVSAEAVAEALGLPAPRVVELFDDLERNLFFLVRNDRGEATWAFPLTVDRTAHHLSFSSGERLWAA